MTERVFVKGLFVNKPSKNAPKHIIAKLSVNAGDLIAFIAQNAKDNKIKFTIKESSKDPEKWYAELDTWEGGNNNGERLTGEKAEVVKAIREDAVKQQEEKTLTEEDIDVGSIPF